MITRFYVDNYKCLVNFEYKPKPMELILGANGSGKTTVFEALEKIKRFAFFGEEVDELFDHDQQTRWKQSNRESRKMRFELTLSDRGDVFEYVLVIDLDVITVVMQEDLKLNGEAVVESQTRWLNTYPYTSDNPFDNERMVTIKVRGETKTFPVSHSSQSILLLSAPGIYRFTSLLTKIHIVSLDPKLISSEIIESDEERDEIESGFRNFASYFARSLQEKPESIVSVRDSLSEVMDNFYSLSVARANFGDKYLKALFKPPVPSPERYISYRLNELSDGQRVLIALYTLTFCAVTADSTLLIDEPENFISSRELQPWLMLLRERIEDFGGQAILISHHPEFINVLAPQDAIQFRRKDGGPVMIRPFETAPYQGLTPAEIVARGWENE